MRDQDSSFVKEFEYRTPRYPYSRTVQLTILIDGNSRMVSGRSTDISGFGMCVSLAEPLAGGVVDVTLRFPLDGEQTLAVPARLLYREGDLHGFVFEFSSAAQSRYLQNFVAHLGRLY